MASVLSGTAGRKTGMWTAQQAAQRFQDLTPIYGQQRKDVRSDLNQGYGQGMRTLDKTYGQSMDYLNKGFGQGIDTLRGMQTNQLGAVDTGYGAAAENLRAGYGQALDVTQPFYDQSMQGYGMYQNALGLGGAEGTAAAQGAFTAGPGYQWQVDQATNQAQRAANKVGGLYGGNTTDQTTRLASNLANQEYGNWIKNLSGFQGAAQNATGMMSDLYKGQGTALSGLDTDRAKLTSDIYGNAGKMISTAQIGQGAAQSQLTTDYGQNKSGMQVGQGQSMANNSQNYWTNMANATNQAYETVIPAGQNAMQAGQAAAQNRMGMMMGGLQLGASMFGGGSGNSAAGGGGLLKMLFG